METENTLQQVQTGSGTCSDGGWSLCVVSSSKRSNVIGVRSQTDYNLLKCNIGLPSFFASINTG